MEHQLVWVIILLVVAEQDRASDCALTACETDAISGDSIPRDLAA
jgi:hypothetical protein